MESTSLNNSAKLFCFTLKKDRVWLPSWIIAVIVAAVSCAPLFPAMAETETEISILEQTMKSPVMVALTGPIYGDEYTYGIMFVQMMLVWLVILIAIMNIFFVIRHTRREEEDGRTEILRSLPIGKQADMFSLLVIVFLFNFIIAICSGIGIYSFQIKSMDFAGCMLFGAALGSCGLFFAAVAMLFAQLSSTSKGATGLSLAVLGFFYLLRAGGDIKDETISLFTPFGLAGRVQYFYKNDPLPLVILIAISAIIFIIAFIVNVRRDVGGALFSERKGRENAGMTLNGAFGLSLRLVRGTVIAWAVAIIIFAASYGSVFGDLTSFYETNDFFKAFMGLQGNSDDLMNSMVSTLMLIMTLIAVIPVISIVLKLKSEAKKDRVEQIYAKSVSKTSHIMGYFVIAIIVAVLMQILCVLGMWSSSEAVLNDPIGFAVFMKAAFNLLPAMFFFAGLGVFITGVFPKATPIVWIYLVYCFVVSYLGELIKLPKWGMKISVFGLLPHYPAEEIKAAPIIALLIATLVLAGVGIVGYRKRDLTK